MSRKLPTGGTQRCVTCKRKKTCSRSRSLRSWMRFFILSEQRSGQVASDHPVTLSFPPHLPFLAQQKVCTATKNNDRLVLTPTLSCSGGIPSRILCGHTSSRDLVLEDASLLELAPRIPALAIMMGMSSRCARPLRRMEYGFAAAGLGA